MDLQPWAKIIGVFLTSFVSIHGVLSIIETHIYRKKEDTPQPSFFRLIAIFLVSVVITRYSYNIVRVPAVVGFEYSPAYNTLDTAGLKVMPVGSGKKVLKQEPAEGSLVQRGDEVKITLSDENQSPSVTSSTTAPSQTTASHTHSWGDWHVTQNATCAQEGKEMRYCAGCTVTQDRPIAKLTLHSWGSWTVSRNATCAQDGTEVRRCTVCSKEETRSIAKLTFHTWGDWTVSRKATIYTAGEKQRVCRVCSQRDTMPFTATQLRDIPVVKKEGRLYTHSASFTSSSNDPYNISMPGYVSNASDKKGNRYQYGIHLDGTTLDPFYVIYQLDGKYTSFTAYCAPSSTTAAASTHSKQIKIFLDGSTVPVYTSPWMTTSSTRDPIALDVTNVKTLRIEYSATKGDNDLAVVYDGLLQ